MRKKELFEILDVQRRLCDRARDAMQVATSSLDAVAHLPTDLDEKDSKERERKLEDAVNLIGTAYSIARKEAQRVFNAMCEQLGTDPTDVRW